MEAVERKKDLVASARRAMRTEAEAILAAASRLNEGFDRAVDAVLRHRGKVILTGIGKSGHIARQLAATLQSTGTSAVFLHPAEAAHGDFGVCQPGDPVLMISKSGTTEELLRLVEPFREHGSPLIGILGSVTAPLAAEMDIVLDASVQKEADAEGFTPTASAVVALAIGHGLVVALMEARGFGVEDFARSHAGGQLGRSLRLRVADAMHSGEEVAWASPTDSLKQVVIAMSRKPLGAACVVDPDGKLVGLVVDGDVRRALQAHDDIRTLTAADVMTKSPTVVDPTALLHDALRLMEDRPSQISVLPVVDGSGKCAGLIRIHDIVR